MRPLTLKSTGIYSLTFILCANLSDNIITGHLVANRGTINRNRKYGDTLWYLFWLCSASNHFESIQDMQSTGFTLVEYNMPLGTPPLYWGTINFFSSFEFIIWVMPVCQLLQLHLHSLIVCSYAKLLYASIYPPMLHFINKPTGRKINGLEKRNSS